MEIALPEQYRLEVLSTCKGNGSHLWHGFHDSKFQWLNYLYSREHLKYSPSISWSPPACGLHPREHGLATGNVCTILGPEWSCWAQVTYKGNGKELCAVSSRTLPRHLVHSADSDTWISFPLDSRVENPECCQGNSWLGVAGMTPYRCNWDPWAANSGFTGNSATHSSKGFSHAWFFSWTGSCWRPGKCQVSAHACSP